MQVWPSPSYLGLGLWAPVAKAAGTNAFGALCSLHLLFIPFPFLSFFPPLTLPIAPSLHLFFPSLFLLSFPTTLLISCFSSEQGLAVMGEPADTPGKVLSQVGPTAPVCRSCEAWRFPLYGEQTPFPWVSRFSLQHDLCSWLSDGSMCPWHCDLTYCWSLGLCVSPSPYYVQEELHVFVRVLLFHSWTDIRWWECR